MKACVLHDIGNLICEDVPDPKPSAGEVLLKIKASGVCGSDISRVLKKGTYKFPTIPGHEFAGEIIGAGDSADKTLIGKTAAVFPLLPCFNCALCETGEYAMCKNYGYFGSRNDGGFAEYIAVPVWNLVLCDGLSYEEAAMAEPAAVAVHALGRAGVPLSGHIAVFGAGAIGLMLASYACACGAGTVALFDIDTKRLDFARQVGFEYAFDNSTDEWFDQLMKLTDNKGADLAIEAAGVSAAVEGCLRAVKPAGKVVLTGNPGGDMRIRQHIYWEILRKQLNIYGTWNSDFNTNKNDWRAALNMMKSKRVNLKPLVTHRFSLGECGEAFGLLTDTTRFSCRVMFINK